MATWCVDPTRAIKSIRITLANRGARPLNLRVIAVVDWIMGAQRSDRQSVRTSRESLAARLPTELKSPQRVDLLLATQCEGSGGFGGSTAFVALRADTGRADAGQNGPTAEWTCDRREFFSVSGQRIVPDRLGERAGLGLDPCAATATTLRLAPRSNSECVLLLGHGDTPTLARALAREVLTSNAAQDEQNSLAIWSSLLDAVQVRTPDPLFDALVNRWLLYQTQACRLWARAGFYQAGGAIGFRDQLQDAMALSIAAPNRLRDQLLLAASRQFVEGDVQHWWHAPTGAGVRTHISDDLLWLPHATHHYLASTGDNAVLDEWIPFLDGQQIPSGAEDAYFVPHVSVQTATLYEHCALTLDRSLAVGSHGLPLMGSGDWNDGMNRVGNEGRGESVWLGWFLCLLVTQFAPLAQGRNDIARAAKWLAAAEGWRTALQRAAWDGHWFVRAFFDDGSPLGSHANAECRIDLIAQAWSVLSGAASPAQQRAAMAAATALLVDDANGVIKLLDPPLVNASPNAGYIQAYPPGVRENGGQYSHGVVWALMAQAALGDGDAAYRTFTRLSPAHRSAHPLQGAPYELEPYVMAGDVYTHAPYAGRGGWSWYTGSAALMYRAAIESICGLQVRGGSVRLTPRLPSHWPHVTLTLRRDGRVHELIVCTPGAAAEISRAIARNALTLIEGDWLLLADAGNNSCHLLITAPAKQHASTE